MARAKIALLGAGMIGGTLAHIAAREELGDELSLADIPAGSILFRYFELDIERPRLPHVEAWYERLKARPAYADHVTVPFGELYGRLSY